MTALAGRRGLLDELGLNLRCSHTEDGHKHWAPHPKYWVGRECMAAVGENKKGEWRTASKSLATPLPRGAMRSGLKGSQSGFQKFSKAALGAGVVIAGRSGKPSRPASDDSPARGRPSAYWIPILRTLLRAPS